MNGDELRLRARGLEIAGLRWNAGASRRVLCLHGWLDNAASFSALAPLLAGCDVVAIDLPGHGRSGHRGAGTLQHFVEYIADTVAVLDALGWQECVLLGHSLGAGIAAFAAATVPARIRALLLVEGLGSGTADDAKIVETLRDAVAGDRRGPSASNGYPDLGVAIAARQKGYWPLSPEASRRLLERALAADAEGILRWHTDPRLRQTSPVRLTEAQCRALLAAIEAPALLLGADQGLFRDPALHAARIACLRDVESRVLPGTHHLHLEAETAPAVATALLEWLARRNL